MDENIREFRNTLSNTSWNDIHSMDDNNRKWSSLITVIMEAHNKSCPEKDIKVPDTVKPLLANYMTEGLLESRKTLHKLF